MKISDSFGISRANCKENQVSRPRMVRSGCLCSTMVLRVTFQPPFCTKLRRTKALITQDYINTLCPGTSNNNVKDRGPSIRSLRSLPLDGRYKVWFREGGAVNRFDTLKHLAVEECNEEILKVILKYARLVQGNWVAKSPLVYGKDSGLEVIARDNVLAQFQKNIVFSGKQLPQRPDLKNATKDVLKVFARPSGSDWIPIVRLRKCQHLPIDQ